MKPRRPPRVTLKRIRKNACPQDRNGEALAATAIPFVRPASSRYDTFHRFPQTLEELRIKCEPYGDAAVEKACWSGITSWLMSMPPRYPLPYPIAAASNAIRLCRDCDLSKRYPDLTGKDLPPELTAMTRQSQDGIRTIAAAIIVAWQEAGAPMDRQIEYTYQYIVAYKRSFPIRAEAAIN